MAPHRGPAQLPALDSPINQVQTSGTCTWSCYRYLGRATEHAQKTCAAHFAGAQASELSRGPRSATCKVQWTAAGVGRHHKWQGLLPAAHSYSRPELRARNVQLPLPNIRLFRMMIPPADTTFPCVDLESNPSRDSTWLAFEEAARTHVSTSERPNSPAIKFKHFPTFKML
eukprot:995695-Pelagomonas_calceolata.AAC.2